MLAEILYNPIGAATDVMVPEKTQVAADCLPKAQSKSIVLDDLTVSDQQVKLETLREQSSENQVSDRAPDEDVIPEIFQPCVNLAEAVSTELTSNVVETLTDAIMDQEIPQEFAFPSPDPVSTLEIHASPRSDQGDQGTCSLPSSSVNPPNISYTSLLNNPLFSDPFEYELDKLRRQEGNLRKNFEETTSELMAELERKMTEARSEYDTKSKEIDVEYKAKTMEEEANKRLVATSSLLANAFVFKGTYKSEGSDLPVATRSSQQQQQAVETNTHVNSTAPPQPSFTVVGTPISHYPHGNTSQPRPVVAESNTPMTSTAPPRPSVTVEAVLLNSPCCNTAQTRPPPPSSSSAASSPPVHGTAQTPQTRPPPLVPNITPSSATAVSTPQPRPSPLIPNITTPSSASSQTRPPLIPKITPSSATAAPSPPVRGTVRRPAPHLQPFRPSQAPNTPAASTIYPTSKIQEQKQGNSNVEVVCLSDDDD